MTKTSYTMDKTAFYGAIGNVATDYFTIRFDQIQSSGYFKIGFVSSKFWSIEGKDKVSKGWYILGKFDKYCESANILGIRSSYKEQSDPVSYTSINKTDRITVVIVRENDSIKFIKNYKYCIGTHKSAGIQSTDVFPAIDIKGGMGASLSLLVSRINNFELM